MRKLRDLKLVREEEIFLYPEGISNEKGIRWRPGTASSRDLETISLADVKDQISLLLNDLEDRIRTLEASLTKEEEHRKSLQQDLRQFSTFEQICNSGLLRNFKLEAEGEIGQAILGMMLRTMELQLGHLQKTLPGENSPDREDLPLRSVS